MADTDYSRSCAVGLLTEEYYDNISTFVDEALDAGHDFVATPIVHPSYQRVLHTVGETQNKWRNSPVYDRKDLILKAADRSDITVGLLSNWFELNSSEENIRINSELALKQELAWSCHIGLFAVISPEINSDAIHSWARALNYSTTSMGVTQLWVRTPLVDVCDVDGNLSWKRWNRLRCMADQNSKIHVALELTRQLPQDQKLLDMWLAEPIKAVIVPAEIFISNDKGYPVLSKGHQQFVKKLMHHMRPQFMVTVPPVQLHKAATPSSYQEYLRFLNRNLPDLNDVERFASGYQDYLQAPLQPLMDNLDNSMYETFERDPIKYQQYEKAVYQALIDRVPHGSDYKSIIMVVGAGRGPLVNCCLRAAEKAERKVHIYAVEKNPNAYVTLQNAKSDVWHDRVTIVFEDMRKWSPPKKCDILVSELLGSFGDNELSPECLDGAQKFIKPNGISIPASYTAFAAPMASAKLWNEVAAYKDLAHSETPYVVMFEQMCELAKSKPLWTFEHPNKKDVPEDGNPTNNAHNSRHQQVQFTITQAMTMHGIAGYFEAVLYNQVMISIHPDTHSPGMFSWFPMFFPICTPVQVPAQSTVTLDFWRVTDTKKVWYEWSVAVTSKDGEDMAILPIHNVGGRSSWVGL